MKQRLSSYQKLKLENERLKSDIYKLVLYPDTLEGMEVRTSYLMRFDLESSIMMGDESKESGFGGISALTT